MVPCARMLQPCPPPAFSAGVLCSSSTMNGMQSWHYVCAGAERPGELAEAAVHSHFPVAGQPCAGMLSCTDPFALLKFSSQSYSHGDNDAAMAAAQVRLSILFAYMFGKSQLAVQLLRWLGHAWALLRASLEPVLVIVGCAASCLPYDR